jgi:hypothetical protein
MIASLTRRAGPRRGGHRLVGKQQVRNGFQARFDGIPDIDYGDDRHWTCGDRGVSEWTIRGTKATGESIEVRGCDLFEFTDGKISRKDSFLEDRRLRRTLHPMLQAAVVAAIRRVTLPLVARSVSDARGAWRRRARLQPALHRAEGPTSAVADSITRSRMMLAAISITAVPTPARISEVLTIAEAHGLSALFAPQRSRSAERSSLRFAGVAGQRSCGR